MTDLCYSLLLLTGMITLVLIDDRRARHRLRRLTGWLVTR